MMIEFASELRHALEIPGYIFYCYDGALLCKNCVAENQTQVEEAIENSIRNGWLVTDAGPQVTLHQGEKCDGCGVWLDLHHDQEMWQHEQDLKNGNRLCFD